VDITRGVEFLRFVLSYMFLTVGILFLVFILIEMGRDWMESRRLKRLTPEEKANLLIYYG
jgi:hypothetical protein